MMQYHLPSNVYRISKSQLTAIPSKPWVYWISETIRSLFDQHPKLGNVVKPVVGLQTSDNPRFIRFWWEVGVSEIGINQKSREDAIKTRKKWFPHMKGGEYCKWYGNQEYVVNWGLDGKEIRNFYHPNGKLKSRPQNMQFYFCEGVTWTHTTSKNISVRYLPPGFICNVEGMAGFIQHKSLHYLDLLAILNSEFVSYIMAILNPAIHYGAREVYDLPIPDHKELISKELQEAVLYLVFLSIAESTEQETTFSFIAPPLLQSSERKLSTIDIQSRIDDEIYSIYGLPDEDQLFIQSELRKGFSLKDEDEIDVSSSIILEKAQGVNNTKVSRNYLELLFYSIGIILGRFQPGQPHSLGSAIYYKSNFAIGSLPEPTEEVFNKLIGHSQSFAYLDNDGRRHIFTPQVEKALQALTVPDGIAVFDPNHLRDFPTLVSKALELMFGQAKAQEVIHQVADGDLRKFLGRDFFTKFHFTQYSNRPVYWPIQSSKLSYGFILFHEKITRNTFYALQQEPYLPTKQRAVQLRLEELGKKILLAQGSNRKNIEKEIDELRQLTEELAQFAHDLEAITSGGYEPEPDWIDDGVILRMAPLWNVIPQWKSEPKKYWERLEKGDFDWSHIAMKYWPKRVREKCKTDKSFAIAHAHEEWYEGD